MAASHCAILEWINKPMKQQGMALVVALVITLIIGIIAVAIGKTALQNQQNAAAELDSLNSYTLAQSAMNTAERVFRNTVISDKERIYSDHANTISTTIDANADWWRDTSNWASNTVSVAGLEGNAPQYRIEEREFAPLSADLEEKNGRQFFRVTSRGEGKGAAVTILQSYIGVLAQKRE